MFEWDTIKRDVNGDIILLYRHQRILEEGLVTKGMNVLDVGGWGVLASRLLEEGVNCTILDNFSEDQYYPARVRTLPHVNGDLLSAHDMRPHLGKYDVVTCFEMLEHCVDQPAGTAAMHTALKDGGVLVGTFPLPGKAHAADDPTVKFLTSGDLKAVLEKSGFTRVVIEPTGSVFKGDEPSSLYFKAFR